jgi:hypothetical protein
MHYVAYRFKYRLNVVRNLIDIKNSLTVNTLCAPPPLMSRTSSSVKSKSQATMAASDNSKDAAYDTLNSPMPSIEWLQCIELGYDGASSSEITPVCFGCGQDPSPTLLSRCSKCNTAGYCSRDCQVKDWKTGTGGGHKHACSGKQ